MKRSLSILFLSVFFITASFAQRNYHQELINHLQQGRCFEARELRMQEADKLPLNDKTLDLAYKSHMALFFNKPDSAAIYLQDLVTQHELILGPSVGRYYGKLLQIYDDSQQFEKGIEICDKIAAYFKRNPFDLQSDFVQNELNSIEKIKSSFKERATNEPQMRIERNKDNKEKAIKLNESEYIRFDAKYNDITLETWFDTGLTYHFCMTREIADQIGVKIVDKSRDSTRLINGIPVKTFKGIIDSINLESIKIYNIPVLVFNEKLVSHLSDSINHDGRSKIGTAFGDKQITMGLPTIAMIGKSEIDWEKRTLSFPEKTEKPETNNLSNFYFIDNYAYLRLKINGLSCISYIDTGADDFLNIPFSFYEKNKSSITIDSTIEKEQFHRNTPTENFFNVKHEFVKDAKVYFNGKHMNQDGARVMISDRNPHMNIFDGVIGVNFFKRLGSKITFDFDNMKIEIKDN